MSTTGPGWYDDGQGTQRWWDGQQWTEHTAPAEGAPQHPAADATAEPQRKSRLWIVWVVLGAAVALIAVLGVILGLVLSSFVQNVAANPGAAATSAVQRYDDAWSGGDCTAYEGSTTPDLREDLAIEDCVTFEEEAAFFDESTDDYELTVTSVRTVDDATVEISTLERYTSLLDENGDPLDEPVSEESEWVYTVVLVDGAWLVDDIR